MKQKPTPMFLIRLLTENFADPHRRTPHVKLAIEQFIQLHPEYKKILNKDIKDQENLIISCIKQQKPL